MEKDISMIPLFSSPSEVLISIDVEEMVFKQSLEVYKLFYFFNSFPFQINKQYDEYFKISNNNLDEINLVIHFSPSKDPHFCRIEPQRSFSFFLFFLFFLSIFNCIFFSKLSCIESKIHSNCESYPFNVLHSKIKH